MQNKPKIVIGITLAKPGGATSFVFGFASWLKQQGYEPIILAGEGEWLFDRCREVKIACLRVPFLQREILPWYDIPAFFYLWKLLRQLRPDVIHLNSTKMGAVGALAARLAGIPHVVYCIGGWVFLEQISATKKWIYEHVERWTAPLKDLIVCVHPDDTEEARHRGFKPREGLQTIPNGIDLAYFDTHLKSREEARVSLNLPDEAYIFGTISNFYPPKDLPRYMEACALVHGQMPHARFVLIGDGMERPLIEQKIKEYNLGSSVLLLGTKEQAWQYLSGFDAFVLPSVKEGMAFALLEAMAASLPCIVTQVGANQWMLEEDAGWIVPPQSPSDLAHAMGEAMQDSQRAKDKGKAARQKVEQRFPLEQTYRNHLALLLERSV